MNIRPATKSDSENISAIAIAVWVDTYATEGVRSNISKYVFNNFSINKINEEISLKNVLVVELENHLLGYAIYVESSESTEIETIYVLPKFQYQGLGKSLLIEIRNKTLYPLRLTCWENNSEAILFYQSQGFIQVGEEYFDLENEKHRNVVLQST